MRLLYAPLVQYSFLLERVASEMGYATGRETWEQKAKRHESEMAEGRSRVEAARVGIVLEPGTAEVWKAYEATARAWWTVHESIRVVLERGVHIEDGAFNETLGKATSAAAQLRGAMVDQISEYERPLDDSADST